MKTFPGFSFWGGYWCFAFSLWPDMHRRGSIQTLLQPSALVSLSPSSLGLSFLPSGCTVDPQPNQPPCPETQQTAQDSTEVKVAQLCPTLCNPMDYTVHGVLQARILEWIAFPFSRGSSQPRDQTQVTRIAGGFFTSWATRDAQDSSWRQMSKRLLFLSQLSLGPDWWIGWK